MSKTAREVIASYNFVRPASDGEDDYNREEELDERDADAIIAALDAAGFVIAPKASPAPVDGWRDIATAPKDGSFIWLSDGFFMRIGYWYVVTKDPSKEHWADMIRAERGGLGDLQWTPRYWRPLPTRPESQSP